LPDRRRQRGAGIPPTAFEPNPPGNPEAPMPAIYDFHIHTSYLKCANETMTVPAILRRHEALGLQTIAITDHLNAPEFLPQHEFIKRDLAATETSLEVFFGVEVNVINAETGAVSIDEAQMEQLGCELVIGGPHTSYFSKPDKSAIIDLQHKLMLAVIANPLVDVLVHPWWFGGGEFKPGGPMEWLTDMSQIPDWHAKEIAEAALAHGTAIEANYSAFFTENQYGQAFRETYPHYLASFAQRGVPISLATDAHDINMLDGIHPMMDILESVGITQEQLWRPERSQSM
jgi:histidinol phosphatase-like PHP family hydrolase